MREPNNLPKAISHKKLSSLLLKAKKDKYSSIGEEEIYDIQQQEFIELLQNWEEYTNNLLKKFSSKDEILLKNKSSNSIMALGAMEVHLNMAKQALKVFLNDEKD